MGRRCDLTNTGPISGHNVSHSNRKTKRRFEANLQQTSLYSEALGRSVALRVSTRALRSGGDDPDDPQHGSADRYAPVKVAATFADGEVVRVGELALTAHLTPGHTPGSTSWSWRSCEQADCLDIVYADSLTALTAGSYRYSDPAHPERLAGFRRGLDVVADLPCDILVTPHPEASGFDERIARRGAARGRRRSARCSAIRMLKSGRACSAPGVSRGRS